MFQIKICGITNAADARAAQEYGADAIGLNFYTQSPRFVNLEEAQTIVTCINRSGVQQTCMSVGVFVNAELDELHHTASLLQLGWVQLHGDEPPEYLAGIDEKFRVIRVYRSGLEGLAPLARDLEQCGQLGRRPDAVLVDAAIPGSYGGTGHQVDWSALVDFRSQLDNVPLILAGGLNPDNVAEAIGVVRPDGVDVASGVESSPGFKEGAKLRSFIAKAKEAFVEIGA